MAQGIHFLSRFPILNRLPLKLLHSQGDVRRTIHEGVGRELQKRCNAGGEFSFQKADLLSVLVGANQGGEISETEMLDHVVMIM